MRFTRRMLEIELDDLIPNSTALQSQSLPLFFRVLGGNDETLAIELWDRGELLGRRSISISVGRSRLLSRRIALAAVELARRAPQQVKARKTREAAAEQRCLVAKSAARVARASPRLRLDSGLGAYTTGPGDSWLVGAELRPTVGWQSGVSLGLQLEVLQGRYRAAPGDPHLRWIEVAVVPGHDFSLTPTWRLGLSLPVGFASVIGRGMTELSGVPEQDMTWSVRTELAPRIAGRLNDGLWLELSPSVGWTLRDVPFRAADGSNHALGGLWLGASIGVSTGPRH